RSGRERGVADRTPRYAQDGGVRIGHGLLDRFANLARELPVGRAATYSRIEVVASCRHPRQVFTHGESDRAPDQSKADDRDAGEVHRAAIAKARNVAAMASICSRLPIVMRRP